MKSGLLWYDNSTNPLAQKIQSAARRYQEKFGIQPNRCYVNPLDLVNVDAGALPILTEPKNTIVANHLWLGVDETIRVHAHGIIGTGSTLQDARADAKHQFAELQLKREQMQHLAANEWEKQTFGDFWLDPFGGGYFTFESALAIQSLRDARDNADFTNAETPLGEIYGGE